MPDHFVEKLLKIGTFLFLDSMEVELEFIEEKDLTLLIDPQHIPGVGAKGIQLRLLEMDVLGKVVEVCEFKFDDIA